MHEKPLTIKVQCYAGYMGEETPKRFLLGNRSVKIDEIIDRWLSPDHRYFKLKADDGGIYIIRHDTHTQTWELTMYEAHAPTAPDAEILLNALTVETSLGKHQ